MNIFTIISAFFAGLLSFISPCVLPLVPAYIALIGGISWDELQTDSKVHQKKIIIRTLFFIAGFSIVFTVLGILFSGSGMLTAGSALSSITIIAGILIIVLGINLAFDFLPFLQYEARVHITKPSTSPFGALLMGMAFGAGWTPCVGPMLASILLMVSRSQSIIGGTLALLLYSLGLAAPFLLTAVFFEKIQPLFKALRKHMKLIKIISSAFLVILGIFMLLGSMQKLTVFIMQLSFSLGSFIFRFPVLTKFLEIAVLLIPVISIGIKNLVKKTKPTLVQWIWSGFFVLFVILELANVLSIGRLIVQWLRYQGI